MIEPNNNDLEILHTEGTFRIVRYQYGFDARMYVYTEHNCRKRKHQHGEGWTGFVYNSERRGERCLRCDWRMSDGLQAVFWFLKETSSEQTIVGYSKTTFPILHTKPS